MASTLGPSFPEVPDRNPDEDLSDSDSESGEELEPFQQSEYQKEKTQRLLPPAPIPKPEHARSPGWLAPPLKSSPTRPPGGAFPPTTPCTTPSQRHGMTKIRDSTDDDPIRVAGLGSFSALRDPLVARICVLADPHSVLAISATSRAFYQVANWDSKIWREYALQRWCGDFNYRTSWKLTAFYSNKSADLPPPELVEVIKTQQTPAPPPETPDYAKPKIHAEDAKAEEGNPYAQQLSPSPSEVLATSESKEPLQDGASSTSSDDNPYKSVSNGTNPYETMSTSSSASNLSSNPYAAASGPIISEKYLRIPGYYSEIMYKEWYLSQIDLDGWYHDTGHVPRIRASEVTMDQFRDRFLKAGQPCVITDVVPTWPANAKWHPEALMEKYCETLIKVNEYNADEIRVKMSMRDFLIYMRENKDYKPLYVFDSSFQRRAPELLQDFGIPEYFWEDLFAALDEQHRPAFRWFLFGCAKTGSPFHRDPNGTSAWNAVTHGHKRWALYPPWMDRIPGQYPDDHHPNSHKWWSLIYPTLAPQDKPIEFIQGPGDLIFIPSGWWHAVLNLDETLSVTQNFVNVQNLDAVVHSLYHSEMAHVMQYWRTRLMSLRPELYHYIGNRIAYESSIANAEKIATMQAEMDQQKEEFEEREGELQSEIEQLKELLAQAGVPLEALPQKPVKSSGKQTAEEGSELDEKSRSNGQGASAGSKSTTAYLARMLAGRGVQKKKKAAEAVPVQPVATGQ